MTAEREKQINQVVESVNDLADIFKEIQVAAAASVHTKPCRLHSAFTLVHCLVQSCGTLHMIHSIEFLETIRSLAVS